MSGVDDQTPSNADQGARSPANEPSTPPPGKNEFRGGAAKRFFERREKRKEQADPNDEAAKAEDEAKYLQSYNAEPEKEELADDVAKARGKELKAARGRKLVRLLDEDIDDELDEAFSSFNPDAIMTSEPPAGADASDDDASGSSGKRTVRVLSVRGESVFVDIGQKSEGVIPTIQFQDKVPNEGDLIEVLVDDLGTESVSVRLPGSIQEADWSQIERGSILDVLVKKVNKGGLEISAGGIRGFMPAGQVDIDHIEDFSTLVGRSLRCLITDANRGEKNLVVSHKAFQLKEREEKARELLATLEVGQKVSGIVKRIMEFGAFVDIGGIEGLAHISEMSWKKIKHPSELVIAGQEVKVVVLSIDPETRRIGLGLKQLTDNPWNHVSTNYFPGSTVAGRVTRLMEFGAFVELEPGIEGLIHISELSPNRVRRVADIVGEGQEVEVKILDVDAENRRISLSIKQVKAEADEEEAIEEEEVKPLIRKSNEPLKGGLGGNSGPLFG
ncbi:30S ribosomal protein S1 [Planctomycetes bacterium Pan216]|uniref:30S ribosomal protein S1 n=1 Tax=Kolteria novifilia TaxID=2527975 RepID=A0A518BB74_9BACT|nr:30S ribosomal protein S1 [Planctomycetes bacterium Pan216]